MHAAHSIYFSVLGDHGWIGLGMFLTILLLSWKTANRVIRITRGREEHLWAYNLTRCIRISMIAYGTGGAFLSLAYFDLPWQMMLTLILIENAVRTSDEQKVESGEEPVRRELPRRPRTMMT